MADLDSVPVVPEESIGFYMGVQKGDFKYGLSYSPLKLSSRKVDEYGSYFSKNDLNVTSTKNEVAVSVVHPQFEGAVQIEWGETTSKFTSVPPMIAGILQRFDDGANKTTVWKESGVSANLKLNAGLFADSLKNVWLTASGKVTSAEYNQYSTKAINIQSQQSIGVGIQYRF
jgi:hypothetical protein